MLAALALSTTMTLPPVSETLERLNEDPQSFARELPQKSALPNLQLPVDPVAKEGCRQHLAGSKEAPGANDLAEDLVDNSSSMLRTLEQMEQQGLKASRLKVTPWSDSYWPYALGALAQRYQDDFFAYNNNWPEFKNYVEAHPAMDLVSQGEASKLSPAEKYDLLVGDENWTFTKENWQAGQRFYDAHGTVEGWMGHCHGWAAASFSLPSPQRSLKLRDAKNQTDIEFYLSDIKGLATVLFANGNVPSKFIGGRCNDKKPTELDNRPVNDDCRDTNAGTWHLAVVNQIGVAKRSFVIDATFDYEVWNQPVLSYKYSYFEPQTKKLANSIEEGKIEVKDFKTDRRKRYRSPQTKWIIGVVMDLTYVAENNPVTDSDLDSNTRTVRYTYDLELDRSGSIVGGEWYNNVHPDFLWAPYSGTLPGAQAMSAWMPGQVLNATDMRVIRQNSARGLPAGGIVKKLFEAAQ